MSSTTTPLALKRVSLFDVCCDIATSCPPLDAPSGVIAAWFEHCVRLFGPITRDPSHPEHDEAVEMAAKYSHDANAMREYARSTGAAQ